MLATAGPQYSALRPRLPMFRRSRADLGCGDRSTVPGLAERRSGVAGLAYGLLGASVAVFLHADGELHNGERVGVAGSLEHLEPRVDPALFAPCCALPRAEGSSIEVGTTMRSLPFWTSRIQLE